MVQIRIKKEGIMRRVGVILSAFSALVLCILMPASTLAASSSLGVNPRRDYTIKPGDKISDTLFVRNLSMTDALTMNISLVDFQAQGQTGAPALLLKQSQPTRWSLKPYMTIQKSITIAPNKSADIPFTITIPTTMGPGSYYSAILYSADSGGNHSNLNLSGSDTTLVFVRIPGQANDSLQMTNFGAFTPTSDGTTGVYGSFYGATAPKYLAYEVKNAGNVAEQPSGSIMIKDTFGKQVKLYQDANPNKNLVLIGQTRRVDFCLNPQQVSKTVNGVKSQVEQCNSFNFKPGRYTADLDLFYGTDGSSAREIKGVASFWYLPPWFIIAVVVILAIIAGIIWLIVNAVRNSQGRKYSSR